MKNFKMGDVVTIFEGTKKAVVLEVSEEQNKIVIIKVGKFSEFIVCSSPKLDENNDLSWEHGGYYQDYPII